MTTGPRPASILGATVAFAGTFLGTIGLTLGLALLFDPRTFAYWGERLADLTRLVSEVSGG